MEEYAERLQRKVSGLVQLNSALTEELGLLIVKIEH